MNREIIPFTTEEAWLAERVHDLTSSDVPCLFGVGYQSYEQLLYHKLNKISPKFEPSEEILWGKAFEPVIAEEFSRRNNWNIRRKNEYIHYPEIRLGSSFDYSLLEECGTNNEDRTLEEVGLVEIKNVNSFKYKKDWREGFEIESTPYIEIQVQNELLVSGLSVCYICVCVGGFRGIMLRRYPNKKIQDAILFKAAEFWRRIDEEKSKIR